MTTIETTLYTPGMPGVPSTIGCGRGKNPDAKSEYRAEEILRTSYNLLDGSIVVLLESENPEERDRGIYLAELLLKDIEAQRLAKEAKRRKIIRNTEAKRMAAAWETHAINMALRNHLPLFFQLCWLYEFCSDDKRGEVLPVIERFETRDFYDAGSITIWSLKASKVLKYLERREVVVTERRAVKAEREKGTPNTTPGVDWDKQKRIPKADPGYVASRVQGGTPQRGVTQVIKRDGDGSKKR